jgi:hypothetical protein
MPQTIEEFRPGQRVAITQQIPQRDRVWTIRVDGVVVRSEQRKTGSWFAHAKDHKLWLDRLLIRKDDGELVTVNLDPYTHVEVLAEAGAAGVPAGPDPAAGAQAGERPDRATGHSTSEPTPASALDDAR